MRLRNVCLSLAAALLLALPQAAHAWAHQGHILITRMACLRIINDPAAPEELKTFLKKNMKYDLEACHRLATEEMVGGEPKNYLVGLDGACTLPDRIQGTDEGREPLPAYGVPEGRTHFLDMEYFAKEPVFKEDLSNRPELKAFPHDVKDARYKVAGFVPFRVEDAFDRLTGVLAQKNFDNDQAVRELGYLVHYLEDCHQPQHATIDYKSYSFLAGKVKAVHAVTTQSTDGSSFTEYRVGKTAKINPHGDVEFQLFENAEEPRKTFRADYWKELTAQIDAQAKAGKPGPVTDEFAHALEILSDSYAFLPAVGHAAQAAYADDGKFDPQAFFTHEATVGTEKLTILQIIARRNAAAVLEVEAALRRAWAKGHK